MNAVIVRNARLTTVAMCPIACPVTVPVTTVNTIQQGRNGAALSPNWDGTLPVFRDHFPNCATADISRVGGRHE
jgi:hypothetical protein